MARRPYRPKATPAALAWRLVNSWMRWASLPPSARPTSFTVKKSSVWRARHNNNAVAHAVRFCSWRRLPMTLGEQLTDYVHAAFSGLWIQTTEAEEAEREITRHAVERGWKLAVWDIAQGIRFPSAQEKAAAAADAHDPVAALRALPALVDQDGTALLVMHNLHRFLNNPEVIQTAFHQLVAGKQQRTFVVVLAPVVQIPIELERLFVVIEHALPDREQLSAIARELTGDNPEEMPQGEELQRVLDAAA